MDFKIFCRPVLESALVMVILSTFGCGVPQGPNSTVTESETTGSLLADTQWQLVQFQSMDDAIGTQKPQEPARYTMRLNSDGTVVLKLNCNMARGSWAIAPGADPSNGSFRFGPLMMTRAFCPPPSMDQQIARQAEYFRSYLLRDGRLHLSLMADGGIYSWEPLSE